MFFDTYALVEIAKGNKRYKKYLDTERIILTQLNLMELYYAILKGFGEAEAKKHYFFYLPFVEEITDEVIFKAMQFRMDHKNLSYADCIGYTVAKSMGVKFLTGDIEFEKLEGVEFAR